MQDQVLINFYDSNKSIAPNDLALGDPKIFSNLFPDSIFLKIKQEHTNIGISVKKENLDFYLKNIAVSDFILCNIKNILIGVFTADCLPVVAYNSKKNLIGVIHAGYRGALNNIFYNFFHQANKNYQAEAKDFKIYFGPAASYCCYEVQNNFLNNLNIKQKKFVTQNNLKYFFNLPGYCKSELQNLGVLESNINLNSLICTICNSDKFESHRVKKELSKRQPSTIIIV